MHPSNCNHNKLCDLYRILGVARNATNLELRNAYLKLVMQYHPDKNPEGKAKFIAICTAYHTLTSSERRKQFLIDSDVYHSESFRLQAERQRVRKLRHDADIGLDLYIHQHISLEDAYLGRELTVKYTRMIICQLCHGHCSGTGRIPKYEPCEQCRGNKYIEAQNLIQVQIPMGGPTDGKIRISKRGHETRGEKSGISDLVVLFHLRHHPKFNWQINTSTLYTYVSINLVEALLGFDRVLLVHLDGRRIKVFHPAGKIVHPGAVMRIPGEGMRFDNKNNNSKNSMDGDLLIEFNVEFPTKLVLPANMMNQLTSLLPSCIPPMNDILFVRFKGYDNISFLSGCPTASSSSSSVIPDNEDISNDDVPVVERVTIEEDALSDVGDKESDTVKRARSIQLQGFCPQCSSKPLFGGTILDNMISCCTDNIQVLCSHSSDTNMSGIEESDYGEEVQEEEDLYS